MRQRSKLRAGPPKFAELATLEFSCSKASLRLQAGKRCTSAEHAADSTLRRKRAGLVSSNPRGSRNFLPRQALRRPELLCGRRRLHRHHEIRDRRSRKRSYNSGYRKESLGTSAVTTPGLSRRPHGAGDGNRTRAVSLGS